MRILYLHQYFCPPGGSGNNRSYELARAWVQAGHEVTLLTSPAYFPPAYQQDQLVHSFELDGIRVVVLKVDYAHEMRFRQRIGTWLRFFRKARRRIWKWTDVDLVYASSTPLTIGELGRIVHRRRGIPLVFETVDVWPDVPIGMGILKNRMLIRYIQRRTNRIYRDAAAVVTLSEGMRDQVLSHGVPPGKVHVIHNGTDPSSFPYVERFEQSAQSEQSKQPDQSKQSDQSRQSDESDQSVPSRHPETLVIYTGTVGIANGLDQLVDAAKAVEAQGRTDIQFLVVGQGNDLDRVLAYTAAQKVTNLTFKKRVPKEEVSDLLARADIGCVCFAPYPVLEANSANKFYDYLASGLPVVLNYKGWQADYLARYGGGLTSEQGDIAGWVENIIALTDQPELRKSEGKKGREMVEKYFDRRVLSTRLLELFSTVLKRED